MCTCKSFTLFTSRMQKPFVYSKVQCRQIVYTASSNDLTKINTTIWITLSTKENNITESHINVTLYYFALSFSFWVLANLSRSTKEKTAPNPISNRFTEWITIDKIIDVVVPNIQNQITFLLVAAHTHFHNRFKTYTNTSYTRYRLSNCGSSRYILVSIIGTTNAMLSARSFNLKQESRQFTKLLTAKDIFDSVIPTMWIT